MLWPVVYLTCKQSDVNLLVRGATLPRQRRRRRTQTISKQPMSTSSPKKIDMDSLSGAVSRNHATVVGVCGEALVLDRQLDCALPTK